MRVTFLLKKKKYSRERNFNNRTLTLGGGKYVYLQKHPHLLPLRSSKFCIIYRNSWKDYEKPPVSCRTGIIPSFCRLPAELFPWSFLCGDVIYMLLLIIAALFETILSFTATEVNGTLYMPESITVLKQCL